MLSTLTPGAAAGELPAFETVFPVAPEDESALGARPVFQIGITGVEDAELRRMRCRITLTRETETEPAYVFDQERRRSGWAVAGDGRLLFRPPRPLADGEYRWQVEAWNGVEWSPGAARRLRVDTVPPAEVDGLILEFDEASRQLRLRWDPVATDRDGGTEYVARYRVYRYERDPRLPRVRPFEIGVVETPEFIDRDPQLLNPAILFYTIAAEDEAGNLAERR